MVKVMTGPDTVKSVSIRMKYTVKFYLVCSLFRHALQN